MTVHRPRSVEDLDNIYGMRFLVRTGFNVPMMDGGVQSTFRINRAIPTILYLVERGGRVILLTHMGRDPQNSTKPLLEILNKFVPTTYVNEVVGERAQGAALNMKEGTVLLLENLRSHEGEIGNDRKFAETLATYGSFYVNEAFSVSHREHASIVTLPKLLPNFAGISLLEEQRELRKAIHPKHPSLFILGGAKFETKEPLVEKSVETHTNVFIGGALANDFMKAKGCQVGTSLLSGVDLSNSPLLQKDNLILPHDVVATEAGKVQQVSCQEVKPSEKIVDVGMGSIGSLAPYIKKAKTVIWNGPLGSYDKGFGESTKKCAELIAKSKAFSVVGGGDTVAAIESLDLADSFGFLSAGGGAMLKFLEHGTLPGIEALTDSVI